MVPCEENLNLTSSAENIPTGKFDMLIWNYETSIFVFVFCFHNVGACYHHKKNNQKEGRLLAAHDGKGKGLLHAESWHRGQELLHIRMRSGISMVQYLKKSEKHGTKKVTTKKNMCACVFACVPMCFFLQRVSNQIYIITCASTCV